MSRILASLFVVFFACIPAFGADRPNIVFIGSEDISPDLGCYGNQFVQTPNIDRLASQGVRFDRCFTHAPVCAPSRSGLITGRYPISFGTHHMRSKLAGAPPETFTHMLRSAGYYVSWPEKTDFNFDVPEGAFDDTKKWMKQGIKTLKQPFFAYTNYTGTHESQIRTPADVTAERTKRVKPEQRVDPAKVELPPYYPDTPIVRRDVANYLDNITALDYYVGDVLKEIEDAGLADNTIVVFWGDHGWGMPRGKRWCYDSGTRCPLIIKWPGKIKPGTVRDDLVAVVDFGPTFLMMTGTEIPKELPGQPMFTPAGEPTATPRKYVYAARDRMDETYDRIRAVRDDRYRYVRNFHPELPYAQKVRYGEMMPTLQEWRRLNAEGKLEGPQKLFFAPTKPKEELYDTQADPHEIHNLIDSPTPEQQERLKALREALDAWIAPTGDLGAVPETELIKRGLVRDVLSEKVNRKGR